MTKNDFWARVSGFGIFYRWHPAIALRYLPIVERIKKTKEVGNILEVGSAGLGIAPYLKREVTGVDVEFTPPYHPFLKRVKASALKLPFSDSTYDVVLSVDMLEHLNEKDRALAISEMTRVAKKQVLIGVPSGKEAIHEDIYLHEFYKSKFGKKYKFFEEQIEEKLPAKEDMVKMIITAASNLNKKISVKVVGNENITVHRLLMKGWMTRNFLANIFYRKVLLFFIPILRLFDSPPYYRQLFFVEIL